MTKARQSFTRYRLMACPPNPNEMPAATQPLRILLVEDSSADRELVARAFRDPAPLPGGVELEIVGDADEALAALDRTTFTVLLTDHTLPGRTGLQLLQELRQAGHTVPVVLMTGSGDEALAVAALHNGAADYVVKEVGFERALPIIIERVLARCQIELQADRDRERAARHTRQLEHQVEEQVARLRRALQESEVLRRVGQTLAAARELKPATDFVTQTAAQLMRARAAALMLRSGEGMALVSVWGALKQAPGFKSGDLAIVLGAGWGETAAASLREDETEIGLLWVARSTSEEFSPRDLNLLEALADLLSLAIVNVRAHQKLKRLPESHVTPLPSAPPAFSAFSATASMTERPAANPLLPQEQLASPEHAAAGTRSAAPFDPKTLSVPPFPAALGRLLALADGDDATPEAIEDAVGLDPALAARAIRFASVPALGRARPAASVREAVTVVGLQGIRNLAFSMFSRGMVLRQGVIDEYLWEQSLWISTGAQLLIKLLDPQNAEDAYLCGLVCNVGGVAMNNAHPERYERAVRAALAEPCPLRDAERTEFGITAAQVTVDIVSQWHLPPRVTQTLRHWANPSGQETPLVLALRWGALQSTRSNSVWKRMLGENAEPEWITHTIQRLESGLGLPPPAIEDVIRQTVERCAILRDLVA